MVATPEAQLAAIGGNDLVRGDPHPYEPVAGPRIGSGKDRISCAPRGSKRARARIRLQPGFELPAHTISKRLRIEGTIVTPHPPEPLALLGFGLNEDPRTRQPHTCEPVDHPVSKRLGGKGSRIDAFDRRVEGMLLGQLGRWRPQIGWTIVSPGCQRMQPCTLRAEPSKDRWSRQLGECPERTQPETDSEISKARITEHADSERREKCCARSRCHHLDGVSRPSSTPRSQYPIGNSNAYRWNVGGKHGLTYALRECSIAAEVARRTARGERDPSRTVHLDPRSERLDCAYDPFECPGFARSINRSDCHARAARLGVATPDPNAHSVRASFSGCRLHNVASADASNDDERHIGERRFDRTPGNNRPLGAPHAGLTERLHD